MPDEVRLEVRPRGAVAEAFHEDQRRGRPEPLELDARRREGRQRHPGAGGAQAGGGLAGRGGGRRGLQLRARHLRHRRSHGQGEGALGRGHAQRLGQPRHLQHDHEGPLRRRGPRCRPAGVEGHGRRRGCRRQHVLQLPDGRRRPRELRGSLRHPARDGPEGRARRPLHRFHHDEGREEGPQPPRRVARPRGPRPRRCPLRLRRRGPRELRPRRLHCPA
mmetsp:Transcript_39672/g.114798  ORF Transcript_39672/g.114798 Transcript_39672/m.114798 type:complete len:219 (-) Transcript_39672:596-1252(-)